MNQKIIMTVIGGVLLFAQLALASEPTWSKIQDGYYGTWDYATPRSDGHAALVAQCGFKISWTDRVNGAFIAETTRNQTNGGSCDYVMLKYQCTGTTCLSRNANPIDLLPDGSFVFYSYKYNLPLKYKFYGTDDQTENLFMGFGSVGVWNGRACSSLKCPEAHAMAVQKATEACKAAGYSTCKEIWFQQIDWYNTPSIGLGAHYFATVRGL